MSPGHDLLAESPAWQWLGLKVADTGDGWAAVEMPTHQRMANRQGVVHGGFISMLADSAMGRAMASALPDGERHYSFDLKLSFINLARVGETLHAVARVLHGGRRTGVAECRVESPDGRLVATASASFTVYLPKE